MTKISYLSLICGTLSFAQ